jgi:hypothetical protein
MIVLDRLEARTDRKYRREEMKRRKEEGIWRGGGRIKRLGK